MKRELETQNWSWIDGCENVNEAVTLLNDVITSAFNNSFPLIKVKISTGDPPYMSPLVKHLCKIRNKSVKRAVNENLQRKINALIRENMVSAVKNENGKNASGSKKWWDTVNKITGRKTNHNGINIDPNVINNYFQAINTDDSYILPKLVPIPNGTRIPHVDASTVERLLEKQKKTSAGPDGFPHWLWKDFAKYLAPIITKIFNMSLEHQSVPLLWKSANLNPIPKETPLTECTQLRPISITNIIMRLFEKIVLKTEISPELQSLINDDQFAYKEGTSATDALIMCHHKWLNWLEGDADQVRVISFDLKKAFDSVSHSIICKKLEKTNINPYIINWIANFLTERRQRVIMNGIETNYVDINKGVPQGTVLGPFLFSLMINDLAVKDPDNNLLVKFADDMTVSAPVKDNYDSASAEVDNIEKWTETNRMSLNLAKTWEMIVSGKSANPPPELLAGIERKTWLKVLGTTLQNDPSCWDLHVDDLLSRASSRMHILRICRSYGYSKAQLTNLFDTLIMSLFSYGIEVWGSALKKKYLDRIDKFLRRSHRYGYTTKSVQIIDVIKERDMSLFKKICSNPDHPLYELLPPKKQRPLREREHGFILPRVKTERFKRSFLNRCLFNNFS